jgi:hypothetical protein
MGYLLIYARAMAKLVSGDVQTPVDPVPATRAQKAGPQEATIMNPTKDAPTMDAASVLPTQRACEHRPACPTADASDREAAHLVASHPEQGWVLLCNGVVMFDDTGELLPDGRAVAPHRRS